jgi:N-acetylglutamate synthase-like GNAT family acetyltransferase
MSDDVSTKGLVARADRLVARAERVDRAVAALKTRFAPLLPGGEIQDTGRAIWTLSATPLLVANGVIRYDARDFHGPESERDLDSCLAVLSTYDVPWRFCAWHHLGADLLMPHLIARGLIGTESAPAMWLDLRGGFPDVAEPPTIAVEDGVEIRRATTASELHLWTQICTSVFGIPNEYEDVFEVMAANPQAFSAIAYAGGRAVGCLSMTVEDGLAVVDNFGVLPSYRRRGIGRRLLEAAQDGATSRGAKACVVLATPSGTGICARLGYTEVTSVTYLMAGASTDLTCDQAMAHG